VDAEVGLLADCLFAAAPSASSVGLHEALAAAAAEVCLLFCLFLFLFFFLSLFLRWGGL
jgi:hypothetical protein